MENKESWLGAIYRQAYEKVCGRHPNLYPWHFQWLATLYLRKTLKRYLPQLHGRVLDVGCGDKPYRAFFSKATDYVGLDISTSGKADVVVSPESVWPFDDASFDVVFATQVLEHVENLPHVLNEMDRVCKKNGTIVLSFPFLYCEHGAPFDYRRFTVHGAARLLPYSVQKIEQQGGIGSTLVVLVLCWIENTLNMCRVTRLLKGVLFPLWIPFCFGMNVFGWLLDKLDVTHSFYSNVFIVFKKAEHF